MCVTLLRFSEFYENPAFKGKYFTLEQFKTWYKKLKNKKRFTYYKDWDGFNLEGKQILEFRKVNFMPFSKEEIKFLKLIDFITNEELMSSYIICTSKVSSPSTFTHEMAHALFSVNEDYKIYVERKIAENKYNKQIHKMLKALGYDKSVFVDETHAYVLEDYKHVEKECHLPKDSLKSLSESLNAKFDCVWAGP